MTRAKTWTRAFLVLGALLLGWNRPTLANGKTPKEADIRREVTQSAREFLDAVRKRQLKAILAMVSERGWRCHDEYTPKAELAADLKKPGTRYHALLFDTSRLRELVDADPPYVSLLELAEKGGRLSLEVVFWDDPRGPLLSPCVYVKADGYGYEPTLCFHEEKGRWRLWKSPQPTCD